MDYAHPMETAPTTEELDRERIEGSIQVWWDSKPGCSDGWLKGILRSSEFESVDAVVSEQENRLTHLNQWRFLKLKFLVNKVRFDAD
jgi:hypothetical protein